MQFRNPRPILLWCPSVAKRGHYSNGPRVSKSYIRLDRGGWSHCYMHDAAPIVQYMAASTQFNQLSQQIIIYIRAQLYLLTSSGMAFDK